MLVNRVNLNEIFILIIILLSFLAYEINIYKNAYEYILIFIMLIGSCLFLINISNKSVMWVLVKVFKANLLVHILSILLLISAFFTSIKYGIITYEGFFRTISVIVVFYVFYLFVPIIFFNKIYKKIEFIMFLISFSAIIAILIKVRGNFWGYIPVEYSRIASIFFDPNYFGTICAIGFLVSLRKKLINIVIATICLIALILSGSRGALISLCLTLVFVFFYKRKFDFLKFIYLVFLILTLYIFVDYLIDIGFFRLHNLLSGREYLWRASFKLIMQEPFWGYGYDIARLLNMEGLVNSSSHNLYLDYILTHGILSFIVYLLIIIFSVYRGVKFGLEKRIVSCVVLLLINSNSIVISLGGIGFLSLLFTIFLGICYNYPYIYKFYKYYYLLGVRFNYDENSFQKNRQSIFTRNRCLY